MNATLLLSSVSSSMIETVLLDGDDTLWHNEPLFAEMTNRFLALLSTYHTSEWIQERLYETEIRNLRHYGYGIKSFVLSMIETAIELTEGRIGGSEIDVVLDFGKEMLEAPVTLLDHAEDAVARLADGYRLMLVTKGDLFDQESKIARSGLADFFDAVEIVAEKSVSVYRAIASRNDFDFTTTVMVGDSLKSDILPVATIGGNAIHVPYGTTWQHEAVHEDVLSAYEYQTAASIREVPVIINELDDA
jgi:putative hydrolase of the HAD superfamily